MEIQMTPSGGKGLREGTLKGNYKEVRQEEREHASKLRARMNRPDMAILFGGNRLGRPRQNLLMKNKYARLNDSPSPPKMGLDEWEASTDNRIMPGLTT